MKYRLKTVVLLIMVVLVASCGKKSGDEGDRIAKINDHVITEKMFRRELAASAYFHNIAGLTFEDKKSFLGDQIRKELLIQEAVKRGFHKEEGFRQVIERYWEQTLISKLLQQRSAALEKDIIVTNEEIEARYRDVSRLKPDLPSMAEVRDKLGNDSREEKKTRALEAWVDSLGNKAEITVYENNLRSLR
jgi:hypothetical protein